MRKNFLFWFFMIIFIALALFLGYKFYYNNYYLPNQGSIISQFNIADLKSEDLCYDCTKEHAISILGEPNQTDDTFDLNTNDAYETFYYDNITLYFKNNKLYSLYSSSDKVGFKDIKIGDSAEKVLNNFYQDSNASYALSSKEQIIGDYIYGTFNSDNLESIKTKEAVFYAYKTKPYVNDENVSEYKIIYCYMNPPYINEYASLYDKKAELTFYIKDEKVNFITWTVEEGLKDTSGIVQNNNSNNNVVEDEQNNTTDSTNTITNNIE